MTDIQPGTGWVHSDVFGGGQLWATINWYTTEFHTSDWPGTLPNKP